MSRDLLNLPYLAEKLKKAQGELAAGVKPGSVPHPRRVLKMAGKQVPPGNGNIFERTTRVTAAQKPRNPRRRKRKDQPPTQGGSAAEAGGRGSIVNEAGGQADTERTVHPGKEEEKINVADFMESNSTVFGSAFEDDDDPLEQAIERAKKAK